MSIATKRGDGGQTSLVGGNRVSKGEPRVEAYGTIDELNSVMGFARSICDDAEVCELVKAIQRELFALDASLRDEQHKGNRWSRLVTAARGNRSTAVRRLW